MTTPQQRPTFLQAIIVSGAGLLIAFFSCLGAIAGFSNSGSSTLGEVGIAGFVLGSLVFVAGGVLLLVVVFRTFFGRKTVEPEVVSPAAPSSSAPPMTVPTPPDDPLSPEGQ